MKLRIISTLCMAFLILSTSVFAEEGKKKKPWSNKAELSVVSLSGNTDGLTAAGKNSFKYNLSDIMKFQWNIAGIYQEDSDEKTAERYSTNLQFDYMLTKRLYCGVAAGWMKDEFIGFENKYHVGPHIGYFLISDEKHLLVGAVGPGYAREEYIDKTDKDFLEGRVFGLYEYAVTEKFKFSQEVRFHHDFDDSNNYKAISDTSLSIRITEMFSLKAEYEIRCVNRPVPETLSSTDKTFMLSLVIDL